MTAFQKSPRYTISPARSQADWSSHQTRRLFQTLRLHYSGGQRYPQLARISQKPDILAKIMAPKR